MDKTSQEAINVDDLVEVWEVLENLAVSLDRLGTFQSVQGEPAAKEALHHYMEATLFDQITNARRILDTMLEQTDPAISQRLETIADNEIDYWNGLK